MFIAWLCYILSQLSQVQFGIDDDVGHTPSTGHAHHMVDRVTLPQLQYTLLEEFGVYN